MTHQIAFAKPKPVILKYCIYARKSMEAEERQALSIESQLNEMKVIVEREKLDVVEIKSESHSSKESNTRPVFLEMIAGIKEGKYNSILTWNPDRLSRNAGDLGALVDLMDNELLLEIRTFTQTFSNSPNEKFLLMILCSQAKLENDNRGINVRRGLRAAVEKGYWPCSHSPLGYTKSRIKGEEGIVHLNEDDAVYIKEGFKKLAYEKYSIYDVVKWFKKAGMTTRTGKQLNYSLTHAMFHNSFYYGRFEFPKKSGKWYKGIHTPIITKKLFDDAQETIAKVERKKTYRGSKTAPFGFLHMMKCGNCGSGITAQEKYKSLKKGGESVYRYYVCCRSRDRDCREKYITEVQLMTELRKVIDRMEVDEIGMKVLFDDKIDRYYKLQAFVDGEEVIERTVEKKDFDLRKYALTIFEDGDIDEQRAILKNLKGRMILKNKKIYIDKLPEGVSETVTEVGV